MNDTRLMELINAELDGVASPAEQAELETLLAADPDAKARFDELKKVTRALNDLPELDPPHDLASRVATRIHGREPAQPGLRRRLLEAPVLRYAASFAFGAVLAALAYEFSSTSPARYDIDQLAGTMAHGIDATSGPVAQRSDFGDSGIGGSIKLQRSDELLVLAVDLVTDEPLGVVLPMSQDLRVVGVLGLGATSPDIRLEGGRLAIQVAGSQRVAVLLGGSAAAVPFQLYRGDHLVHTDSLPVPAPARMEDGKIGTN